MLLSVPDYIYHIRHQSTAAAGLAEMERQMPDCVLLDYRLPDTDGLSLLRQIARQQGGMECAFVLMTGVSDRSAAVAALESGAHDFLPEERTAFGNAGPFH